jgi:hypothetical protein
MTLAHPTRLTMTLTSVSEYAADRSERRQRAQQRVEDAEGRIDRLKQRRRELGDFEEHRRRAAQHHQAVIDDREAAADARAQASRRRHPEDQRSLP